MGVGHTTAIDVPGDDESLSSGFTTDGENYSFHNALGHYQAPPKLSMISVKTD